MRAPISVNMFIIKKKNNHFCSLQPIPVSQMNFSAATASVCPATNDATALSTVRTTPTSLTVRHTHSIAYMMMVQSFFLRLIRILSLILIEKKNEN